MVLFGVVLTVTILCFGLLLFIAIGEGKRLFIKPEYRGKGYARIMIKAMTDKASELGFKEVVFTTKPAVMSIGYGLYKRMGFEELSEENGIVSMRIDLRK